MVSIIERALIKALIIEVLIGLIDSYRLTKREQQLRFYRFPLTSDRPSQLKS